MFQWRSRNCWSDTLLACDLHVRKCRKFSSMRWRKRGNCLPVQTSPLMRATFETLETRRGWHSACRCLAVVSGRQLIQRRHPPQCPRTQLRLKGRPAGGMLLTKPGEATPRVVVGFELPNLSSLADDAPRDLVARCNIDALHLFWG